MFEDIYQRMISDKKVRLIGIWDKDGLEIDKVAYREDGEMNTDVIGAEMADITSRLTEIKGHENFTLKLENPDYDLYVFSLVKDFFLLMVTDKDIISSRIKYLVDINRDQLISKL